MLKGLLVDLVPYGERFRARDHTWWNSEAVFWGSMGEHGMTSRAQVDREHEEWDSHERRPWDGMPFGVQAKDGTPLGYMGLNFMNGPSRWANLGAVIGEKDYWGGGYGTDALLLLVEFAFDELDLRRVWLGTMGLNARVLRQMEKVGFTEEGRRRKATVANGVWYDEVIFGLLREEWPGRLALIEQLGLKAR